MQHWNELRTALIVARAGTVLAAAEQIGVHRATVHRHIDLLEAVLGTKLFIRSAKGYALTEDGHAILDVAHQADQMFLNLEGTVKKRKAVFSGDLILSIFHGFGGVLMPAIRVMNDTHPNVRVQVISSEKASRLEHGEAHIAFRIGTKPEVLDYIVQPFLKLTFGLYASLDYIAQYGQPCLNTLKNHRFVGPPSSGTKRPYLEWLCQHTTPEQFVLTSNSRVCLHQAVVSGLGLGFMASFEATQYQNLVEIVPPIPQTGVQVWSVTHMDLHRTAKVQEFLNILKAETSHDRQAAPQD